MMKVLLHRHRPSAELRNQPSVIYHKLEVVSSCAYKKEHTMPKAASKLAAAPSTPPASISKNPVAVRKSSLPTTSLPTKSTEATVAVPDNAGPQKKEAEASLIEKWPQPTEFRSWKMSFRSDVSQSSQHPEPLWYGLLQLRMLKRTDDPISSASTGTPTPNFQNLGFKIASGLRKIFTGSFMKQVIHSSI